jgi:EAL and modified HD-GYP domain-containing signal transduction protein
VSADFRNATHATGQVVTAATMDIGFLHLVGELPAFINFPQELLISPVQLPLPPERIVVEVLEGCNPSPALLQGLERLRREGHRIALDDYDVRAENPVLLEYANIVKVDIQQYSDEELEAAVKTLRNFPVELVAEKIETHEQLSLCQHLGFDFYQGYFLQKPETFGARRAPTNLVAALQLLVCLTEPNVSVQEIDACIARDVGFSYRVLRCINSSYYRIPKEVTSIRQAIVLLGFEELRKLCSIVILSGVDDRPSYMSVQALVRARMCEVLCAMAGLEDGDVYFMTGFLSMLDVLLGLPMQEALRSLPLAAAVRGAVLDLEGPLGAALRCSHNHEKGAWDQLEFMNLTASQISSAYAQAVGWADKTWEAFGVSA